MLGFQKVFSTASALPAVLTATALLLCAACEAQAPDPAPPSLCPAHFAQVHVTVDADPGDPLVLHPSEPVEVFLPSVKPGDETVKRQVCWVVHDLPDGQTLHIQTKPDEEDLFPTLERAVRAPRTTAKSGMPAAAGHWVYALWVSGEDGGEKLHYTDPEVIIRDKWGT